MTDKIEIKLYKTDSGKVPFQNWIDDLDNSNKKRINDRLIRIITGGNYGDSKKLGGGINELRFFFGGGYRIYFGEHGNKIIILLCGGNKSTQGRDIEKAKEYWKDYISKNYN